MKVLVTGGRDLDSNKVSQWLAENATATIGAEPTFVIEGGQTGADRGGMYWRNNHGILGKTFPADWTLYGRGAGPIRNAAMLKYGKPDVVIAFPGGDGTDNMVDKARAAGVRVVEVAGDFNRARP